MHDPDWLGPLSEAHRQAIAYLARLLSYNAAIAPGGSTSIGFQATHTGNTARADRLRSERHPLHQRLTR